MEETNEIKMLEQNGSAVEQAQEALRNIENENVIDLTNADDEEVSEQMKQFGDSVISGDQLVQLQAFYNRKPKQQVRKFAKIGRNDPCPCGSGKKYKHCCQASGKFDELRDLD